WPHNTGPILTYMAACSDSTCGDDPTTLEFFKIQQDSYMEGSTTTWVQDLIYKGYPYNVTIPTALANGNYIMRHELINMAPGAGNDEDYPSCFQLTVTGGSGSGTPSSFASSLGSTYLAKFPGAYAASDAGLNADGYTYSTYDFPGPAIAS
ncbi:glycoside hydrolase, partial [Clavulina sp. PMI_390]